MGSSPEPILVLDCSNSPSRTKQEFAKDADINNIVKKFIKTGQLPPTALAQQKQAYADYSEIGSFHESFNQILGAREMFQQLPVEIRNRFQNDPGQLLDFVADPANETEARELGLLNLTETPEPAPEPPQAPPTE